MDFYFPYPVEPLTWSGPAEKSRTNMEAIRIAREIQATGRQASPEELETLSRYVGWGDTAVLNYAIEKLDIRGLLSRDEFSAVSASALNAHYTALPVISAIWHGLKYLGAWKRPLRVLDPSAGTGHFKSAMPPAIQGQCDWVEIEIEPLTASILAALHPSSRVFAQGYETVNLPKNWFDLAVSNVPFGDYPVHFEGMPQALRAAIHDFFFARTVDLLRPGGVMAFITSRYTLDKKDQDVRQYLARHCDLLGAVRLPNNTFKANAGTEVVTDIIFLRKRSGENREMPDWVNTEDVRMQHPDYSYHRPLIPVNRYFIEHPENILGMPSLAGTMYRGGEYTVLPQPDCDLYDIIAETLSRTLPKDILQDDEKPVEEERTETQVVVVGGKLNAEQTARVEAMRAIYKAARELILEEVNGSRSVIEYRNMRDSLNRLYDAFIAKYGPINHIANTRMLRNTPELPFLKALEEYEPVSNTAKKATIFFETTVRQAHPVTETNSVEDALLVSLDQAGGVDIDLIARIAGVSRQDAIRDLSGGRIFREPGTDHWVTDDEYLSGNVALKLKDAEAAAQLDPELQINVEALRLVQPEPLKPGEIFAVLGAGWMPTDIIRKFLEEVLEFSRVDVSYVPALAQWNISSSSYYIPAGAAKRWGTSDVYVLDLVDDTLNSRMTTVYSVIKTDTGETRKVDRKATIAAQAKQAEIRAAFEKWAWSDPDRAERLAQIYNERFNIWRRRKFNGGHLTLPGISTAITPRPNQKNGAWRILQSPSTLLDHEVGSGKTMTCIIAAMEGKRLGLVRKAMVVAPNHLTHQWASETHKTYPHARVLSVTSQDLGKDRRGTFLSRISTGNWDIIIVPFSSFKLLPVSHDLEAEFLEEQITQLENYLWEMKAEKSPSQSMAAAIKDIEKAKKRFEAKLFAKKEMAKDSRETVTYEMLGVDMLIVDEFHAYKNLFFATRMTRIAGLTNSESQRAFDMFMKVMWTVKRGGKVVAATGTPITNTLAEAFTMQRYMQYALLKQQGLGHFDAWATQFALAEPGLEMTPDGAGFRMNTRFRKFVNLPELLVMWEQVVDTYRIQDDEIERPYLYNHGPIKVKVKTDVRLRNYVKTLALRAESISRGLVEPEVDNMLKITSDGRKAALDMSLVEASDPDGPMNKIDAMVETIAEIYASSSPAGGVQIIFCDLATPKSQK